VIAYSSKMVLDLYYMAASPPCRSVMMAAKHLGIDLNYKMINVLLKEQMKPEFLKLNPQHTIPTLDDNGFILWESRAIMQYLANAYGKSNTTLYPKDAKKRALVDQRLLFDQNTLFKAYLEAYVAVAVAKFPINEEKLAKVPEALGYLETFLGSTKYAAGDELTLADITIMSTLSSAEESGVNIDGFKLVKAYMSRCASEIKGYDENMEGAKFVGGFVKKAFAEQKQS